MKIAIASDHGGYEYKQKIISHYKSKYDFVDFGTDSIDSVDYPDFAYKVSKSIIKGVCNCGVLICGTGIGMSIAANKVEGIRAAVVTCPDYARLAREHNNANIICLSGRFMTLDLCIECIDIYLAAKFVGNNSDDSSKRHLRRVEKIKKIELKQSPYC